MCRNRLAAKSTKRTLSDSTTACSRAGGCNVASFPLGRRPRVSASLSSRSALLARWHHVFSMLKGHVHAPASDCTDGHGAGEPHDAPQWAESGLGGWKLAKSKSHITRIFILFSPHIPKIFGSSAPHIGPTPSKILENMRKPTTNVCNLIARTDCNLTIRLPDCL